MGEILSTIGSWIKTRYEQVTRALKEAWGVVKSVFEGIMDAVRRVLDAVSCFSFTRETESISVQSETTGAGGRTTKTSVEVGRDKLKIGTERDKRPAVPQKLPSDMSEKEKEKLRKDFKDAKAFINDFENIFLYNEQHCSRKTELRKVQEFMKKPHFQSIQAALARQPIVNPGLA